ncbi:MAG: hypothetical protein EA388_16005 [Nitriliruptor sp.]|nr:MAG: hypothetical protein EA388_16005 [Nitriliruptor sp.]
MKLLVDEALQNAEDRVFVTTDTDFGTILALTGAAGPNVLLLRGVGDSADERIAAIPDVLPREARKNPRYGRARAVSVAVEAAHNHRLGGADPTLAVATERHDWYNMWDGGGRCHRCCPRPHGGSTSSDRT